MKNRVKISIDGKSFTLVGEETEEHMRQVAAYIDEKMTEVRQKAVAVTLDSSLAYVLTSINVADDFFKEKAYTAELEGRLIGMTTRLQELAAKLEEAEAAREEAERLASADGWESKLELLEEKLRLSEKARENAENKLDEYTMALENGNGVQLHLSSAKSKKGKK